jgi:enamine deaminase RidA (YjgF/YER057c/UK114 family)
MDRILVPTPAPWAAKVGYSRAVRAGHHVFVAGTAAVGTDGKIVAPGNPYQQAKKCLQIIVQALAEAGAAPSDVVRTRMFVKHPEHWQEIGRAHGEIFSEIRPATTMVFCSFIEEEMLCEIEAEAVVSGDSLG